jgi:hypothetical protein
MQVVARFMSVCVCVDVCNNSQVLSCGSEVAD